MLCKFALRPGELNQWQLYDFRKHVTALLKAQPKWIYRIKHTQSWINVGFSVKHLSPTKWKETSAKVEIYLKIRQRKATIVLDSSHLSPGHPKISPNSVQIRHKGTEIDLKSNIRRHKSIFQQIPVPTQGPWLLGKYSGPVWFGLGRTNEGQKMYVP